MRIGSVLTLLFVLGLSLGVALSQEETKTVTADPVLRPSLDVGRMWSFHFEGQQKNGEFLELAQPDAEREGKGRTLVITHLEVRQRQTMRWRFVEHRKEGNAWKKIMRRSEYFSLGWLDGTTKFMASAYDSNVGMKFGPQSRPGIEIRQGSGEMAVYAEGYWAD